MKIARISNRLLIGLSFVFLHLSFSVSTMAQTITDGSNWWDVPGLEADRHTDDLLLAEH